ncbi:MAG: hypothetical protein AAFR04_07140 [Pseudomonadota bacterium]
MRLTTATIALSVAGLMAGLASPLTSANAGDFNRPAGPMKKSIYSGVPVPAPRPIPNYAAEWYLRADVGHALYSDNGITVEGNGFRAYDDFDGPTSFSFGFGRYITPSLRAELSIDIRNKFKLGDIDQTYVGTRIEPATTVANGGPGGNNRHTYQVSRVDELRIGSYSGMVNLYKDFRGSSRFTPYIGAGIGIAVHNMQRRASETSVCQFSENDAGGNFVNYQDINGNNVCADNASAQTPIVGGDPGGTNHPGDHAQRKYAETGYGFAANLMAGLAMHVRRDVSLDFGYRFMWMSGDIATVAPTLDRTSVVRVDDIMHHEIRAGIRWNIN